MLSTACFQAWNQNFRSIVVGFPNWHVSGSIYLFQEQVGWGSWLVNWTTLRCTSGSRSSDTLIIWYLLKITLKSHKYFMPLLLLWLHILCAWSMERLVGGQAHIAQNTQNAYCAFWKKHFKHILPRTLRRKKHFKHILPKTLRMHIVHFERNTSNAYCPKHSEERNTSSTYCPKHSECILCILKEKIQAHIAKNTQNAYCAFWKKHFKCILRRTLRMHNVHIWEKHWMYFAYIGRIRVTLIVSACQPGWEEIENLRGNFRKIEEIWEEIIQNEVSLGGSPTINVALGRTLDQYINIWSGTQITFAVHYLMWIRQTEQRI